MALRSAPFLLLVLVAVALRESCFGSSSHSMKYFSTAISEPSQGLPHFFTLGFVDDQLFSYYDSHSRRVKPRVSWMEKFGKEDPQYWDRESQRERVSEELVRENLENLRTLYNQSEGLQTLQNMYGCELRRDGSKGGFAHFGYEGKTFITFNKETLTWVASDSQAQIIQRKWDAIPGKNWGHKVYLEEECIAWLEKHLSYGKETLLRTETPKVTVSSRTEVEDGMETHVCRLDGFYPRDIDASWKRDGEVWLQDTFHGSLAPNADGTYHYWLSVRIDPKERDHYRCHVEHDGLQDPLDVALKEPTNSKSNLGLIIGCVMAVPVIVIAGILAFIYFPKRRQDDYKAAPSECFVLFPCNLQFRAGTTEALLVERDVCMYVSVYYLPPHPKNQAGEDGLPFHYSQIVLGSGVFKEKHLGEGTFKKMRRSGWWKVPLTEKLLCFPSRQKRKAWPKENQKFHKIRDDKGPF